MSHLLFESALAPALALEFATWHDCCWIAWMDLPAMDGWLLLEEDLETVHITYGWGYSYFSRRCC